LSYGVWRQEYSRALESAAVLEIIGVPILFLEQNSPYFVLITLAVVILVLVMMIAYARIEAKYRI